MLQALVERLPSGAPVTDLEALADQFLTREDLVRGVAWRPDDEATPSAAGRAVPAGWRRYTTRELMAVEAGVLAEAAAGRKAGVGVVAPAQLAAALAAHSGPDQALDADQRAMVVELVTGGDGVAVVNAPAGSGKTFALRACRQAWQAAGYQVIGAALSAQAARVLAEGAQIPSSTIAALLLDLDRTGGLADRSVLVIDEAGMVGTRTLGRLLGHARRANAKLVLVGDTAQLPELEAGGLFRRLWAAHGRVQLTGNHRQARHDQAWERAALRHLRAGDAAAAVALYAEQGRIITRPSSTELYEQLVGDWYQAVQAHTPGEPEPMMLAARRADVADLNAHARARLAADGRLGPGELTIGGRGFAVGDRVVTLHNAWRRYGVLNGTRGTITAIDQRAGTIQLRTDDDRLVTLPPSYLTPRAGRRRIDHAYATTGHKAQGVTGGRVFILATDELYQEWGYTALSRGKTSNTLYLVAERPPDPEVDHARQPPDEDPIGTLTATLAQSRAQALAGDYPPRTHPKAPVWLPPAEAAWRDGVAEACAHRDRLARDLRELDAWLADHTLQQRRWWRGVPHHAAAKERKRVEELRDEFAAKIQALDQHLSNDAHKRRQPVIASSASSPVSDGQRIDDPPRWLVRALGGRPTSPAGHQVWQTMCGKVAAYRGRYGIDDPDRALGPPPPPGQRRRLHDWWQARLQAAAEQIDRVERTGIDHQARVGALER